MAVAAINALLAGDSDRELHVRSDMGRVAAAELAGLITRAQALVLARTARCMTRITLTVAGSRPARNCLALDNPSQT